MEPGVDVDVMAQFMEMVTSFKCKACEYVCHKQEDLLDHVRSMHMTADATESSSTDKTEEAAVESADKSLSVSADSLIASLVNGSTNTESTGTSLLHSSPMQVSIQTYVNGTPTNQVVLVEAGEANSNALFTNSAPQQEVYACGYCSAQFYSMEVCKDHLTTDHNIATLELSTDTADLEDNAGGDKAQPQEATDASGENMKTIAEREELADGKVSMATQVERKKPGRKTKAETAAIAAAQKEAEQKEEELEEIEDNDEVITQYVTIEIPGKRRRKVPQYLADYAVPKKVKHVTEEDEPAEQRSKRTYRTNPTEKKAGLPYKCSGCRARLPDEKGLEYHMRTHSKDRSGNLVYKCMEETCTKEFVTPTWSNFKHHAWTEHSLDLGMIRCDFMSCQYRTTVPSKLQVHKEIHSEDKPYSCDICYKCFKQQAQLKNHQMIHVATVGITEKESMSGRHWFVQAQCDICKRTFANQKSLACHIEAVHDKVKPFSCKFCGHTAARKAMMELHMRTHTGEKPFKCDICDYSTGDHNSMRRHRMRHTGDKPYHCPHCSYACIQAVSLKLHLKSKHPGSDSFYSCHKCAYRTVNKTLFSNHLRDHEMGLIDELSLIPVSENPAAAIAAANANASVGLPIKLGPINDMTNGSSNTTQLICSALNAIAPTLTESGETLPENIETTIHTISDEGGVKAHKITFHIPATETKNAKTAEVVVQEQAPAREMDPLQTATIESEIPTGSDGIQLATSDELVVVQGEEEEEPTGELSRPLLQEDSTQVIIKDGQAIQIITSEASQLSEMEMGEDNSITADSSIVTVE